MPKKRKKQPKVFREPLPRSALITVGVAAVLTYLASVTYNFTFDDFTIVAYNPAVQSWGEWKRIFWADYWPAFPSALYRPLTILSFALERVIHGGGPSGFHIVNVLLHASISVLVLALGAELIGFSWGALAAGLVFAVHPVHTEVVAGVVGRAELLSTALVLAAVLMWIRMRRSGTAPASRRVAPVVGLYVLAMASKENAVVLPGLIFIWEWSRSRAPSHFARLREALVQSRPVVFAAAAGAFLAFRAAALGGILASLAPLPGFVENPLAGEPAWTRILTGLANQWHGLVLQIFPARLIADYSFDTLPVRRSLPDFGVLAMAVVIVACLLAWSGRSRPARDLSFAGSWYLVAVLPASNIPMLIGTFFGERLLYLGSVGFCLALGVLLQAGLGRDAASPPAPPGPGRARLALGIAAALVIAFAALALVRAPVWKNNLALFSETVRQAPRNVKARLWLGDALASAGRFEEAVSEYRKALEIRPDYAFAAANLVMPLARLGRVAEAIAAGEQALVLFRGQKNAILLHTLAVAYLQAGNETRFLDYISRCLELDPQNARAHMALGLYNMQNRKDREAARRHFLEALRLDPDGSDAEQVRSWLARMQ